jgi:hypothetical protein
VGVSSLLAIDYSLYQCEMLLLRRFALLRHCVPRNDNPRNDKMLNAKC